MKVFRYFFIILLITGITKAQSKLTGYGVSETEGIVSVELEFEGEVPYITDFVLKSPPRIVLDMDNTLYKLPGRIFTVDKGIVLRIRGSQYKREPVPITRVVVDLDRLASYDMKKEGSKVILTIPGKGEKITPSTTSATTKQKITKKKPYLALRSLYFYRSRGKRDPFMPVLEEESDTLLNVADAKLIGIVRDPTGYIALLEDKGGKGYILREGDRVRKGRVVKIKPQSVVFAIFDFGFTRRVELKLEGKEK